MYNERYSDEQEAKYRATLAKAHAEGYVLDVGCGTGLLFRYIAQEAVRIIGIDISKMLLFQAVKHAKALRKVDLIQADADHLPFRNSEFSTVFAFTVLQNMPNPLETLLEIYRVSKHGAMVAVTGLKKTVQKEALGALVRKAGFHVTAIVDGDKLKCYVVLTAKTISA